jgi:hypothetical protein
MDTQEILDEAESTTSALTGELLAAEVNPDPDMIAEGEHLLALADANIAALRKLSGLLEER